jgi:hypothetical protein
MLVVNLGVATQGIGQDPHTKKPKATPASLPWRASSVKSVEQPLPVFRRDALAAIVDFQFEPPVVEAATDLNWMA